MPTDQLSPSLFGRPPAARGCEYLREARVIVVFLLASVSMQINSLCMQINSLCMQAAHDLCHYTMPLMSQSQCQCTPTPFPLANRTVRDPLKGPVSEITTKSREGS